MSDTPIDTATESVATSTSGATAPVAATPSAASATAPTDAREAPADGEGSPDKGKPPASIQKAINRLTRRAGEAERRAMRAEARAEALEAQFRAAPTQHRTQGAELSPSDFAKYEDYTKAVAREEAKAAAKEEIEAGRKAESERASSQEWDRKRQAFEKEASAQAKTAGIDFEDSWETLLGLPPEDVSPIFADYLFEEAEHKAALVDHFAKNTDELARIAALHPRTQVRELSRIEARLGAKPAAKVTSAHPPVQTVGGRSAVTRDLAKMSPDEYAQGWHERMAKARDR